jgi:large repetitive protein
MCQMMVASFLITATRAMVAPLLRLMCLNHSRSRASFTIAAVYAGDTDFNRNTSAALSQSVAAAGSTTTLASSLSSPVFGQAVIFTATVHPIAPATVTPTGMVTFEDSGVSIGSGTLAGGVGTFTTGALGAGSRTITAAYGGDSNYTTSVSSTLTESVRQTISTTAATSSVNPAVFGQTVTLMATINAVAPGGGTPTGTVTFEDKGVSIGMGTLAGHTGTFTTSSLAVAVHSITALYSGDSNFKASTSAVRLETINKAASSPVVV